jgi:hypothetical protein
VGTDLLRKVSVVAQHLGVDIVKQFGKKFLNT